MRKYFRYIVYAIMAAATPLIWKLLFAGITLAHDCSTEADCLQTAGYNAVTSIGGGIIAILAALLGAHFAGLSGATLPETETPPDTGTEGARAEPTGPGKGPVIIDADGQPLVNWDPQYGAGENGYTGKPGDVWYAGNWIDPQTAREEITEDIMAQQQRDIERETFWSDVQNASAEWMRDRVRQNEMEAAIERNEARERQEAFETLERIDNIADKHDYTDIVERAENNAFNEDGSINIDYVDRLRDALTSRIGRDVAAPDERLREGWVGDFAENTFNDVRHSTVIRMGAGILSGGTSEIYFQSQAAYEAMQRSFDQAVKEGRADQWGYGDALLAGGQQLAEENLPVNIIKTCMDPNATTTDILLATAMDMFQSMDTAETFQNLRGSLNVVRNGGGIMDALTHRADPLRFFPGEDTPPPEAPRDMGGPGRADLEGAGRAEGPSRFEEGGARAEGPATRAEGGGPKGEGGGAPLHDMEGGRLEGGSRLDDASGPKAEGGGGTPEGGGTKGDGGGGKPPDDIDIEGRPGVEGPASPARPENRGLEGRPDAEAPRDIEKIDGEYKPAEGTPGTPRDLDNLPPGSEVRPGEVGLGNKEAGHLQRSLDRHEMGVEFRRANENSIHLREDLGCPPKPPDLHNKTVTVEDVELGLARPEDLGKTGYYDFDKFRELNNRPGFNPDSLPENLRNRYNQRYQESIDLETKIHSLVQDGQIEIDPHGNVINKGLNTDPTTFDKPFVADNDVVQVFDSNTGGPVSPERMEAFYADPDTKAAGITHPGLKDWQANNVDDIRMRRDLMAQVEGGSGRAMGHMNAGGDGTIRTAYMRPEIPPNIEFQNPATGNFEVIGQYNPGSGLDRAAIDTAIKDLGE